MDDNSSASAASASATSASTAAARRPDQVTEHHLDQLQQDLNRATAKLSTRTGAEIRKVAEAEEAKQAKAAAADDVTRIQGELTRATATYHAQRAAQLGIASGGFVQPGQPYLVGERRPEMTAATEKAVLSAVERNQARMDADRVLAVAIERGDVVRLKSGGPDMRVTIATADHGSVFCEWSLDDDDQQADWFTREALEIVTKAPPQAQRLRINDVDDEN
jgi:uncharacterized protein YodC (DUF2158 family)